MIIAGKCPPESEELKERYKKGFEKVELYIEKKHLDQLKQSIKNVKEAEVEVVSVHTPHVHVDEDKAYFHLAAELAEELDAYLVFHSQYVHHVHIPEIEELEIEPEYGYENNPGASRRHLEANILDPRHDMVLDTAHFFMSEKNYIKEMRKMIEKYTDQINLIHLCDSTLTKDGLGFEKGEMNMEKTSKMIADSSFDGILVLEVMPDHQQDALEKWKWYTG